MFILFSFLEMSKCPTYLSKTHEGKLTDRDYITHMYCTRIAVLYLSGSLGHIPNAHAVVHLGFCTRGGGGGGANRVFI